MRFRIELVSAKPFMVKPNPIANIGGFFPILEHDVPEGNTVSATYTVMKNGDIQAGGQRRDDWAYIFDLWCYNKWKDGPPSVGELSGSLMEVVDVNPEYKTSYETHVLINQFETEK